MAEPIHSVGQNQPVPTELYDRGQPLVKSIDSPLSPVSSEDLDITSPISDGHDHSSRYNIVSPESKMETDQVVSDTTTHGSGGHDRLSTGKGSDSGSPRRSKPLRPETDIMKLSAMSGDGYTDSLSSSRPASAASSRSPYKEKEAEKRLKEREKEERFKQARQRMAEERQRKLIELKEQQRIAQENRERQLELRRKKIEELRKREDERRAAVEERRLRREATEKTKREAILLRASERMTRYEAWKTGGRKVGQNPGALPPSKHLSVSTSVLYHKRNPDFASTGGGLNKHPGSLLALNTIPENRRSFLAPSSSPPQRPKSSVNLNTTSGASVKMRENRSPRKARPASVATSMPSFIGMETGKPAGQRSISSDRMGKDKRKKEKEEGDEKKAKRHSVKFSRQSMERLSAPKRDPMTTSVELPKREPIIKSLPANVKLAKETPGRMTRSIDSSGMEDKKVAVVKPSPISNVSKTSVPPIKQPLTPTTNKMTSSTTAITATAKVQSTPTVDVDAPKEKEKDVEDYKARLAEHRRLAREKAEKEAEEERRLQEIERLKEEEAARREEEEQRKLEEESLRLAEEARKNEEERLNRAIEAENKRREEEAQKLEEERIAKELADQKAQEEAEQLEKERLERAKKEEEERVERKKRLEMIMKRVKTDGQSDKTESPNKSVTSSPVKTVTIKDDSEDQQGKLSNANSEENILKPSSDTPDYTQFQTPDKLTVSEGADKPRFRSPLLQQMTESKSDSPGGSERPKFKSPLLQNLLGKNKAGGRINLDKSSSEESRAVEVLNVLKQKDTLSFSSSQSLTNLSQASDSLADKESLEKNLSKSVFHLNMKDEDKDIDTTESENTLITVSKETNAGHTIESLDNGHTGSVQTNSIHVHQAVVDTCNGEGSVSVENGFMLKGGADSGVLMDLGESGTSLQSIPVNGVMSHDLIDSSISMHSVDSNVSYDSREIEEINLSIPSKNNVDLITETTNNINNIEDTDEFEHRTPFIAFEETSNRKQDVPDLLS